MRPSCSWFLLALPLAVLPFTLAPNEAQATGEGAADGVPAPGEIGGPVVGLTPLEREQWLRGRALFDKDFHRSTGVGSDELNADSCRACHLDPVLGGSGALELNVSRFARMTTTLPSVFENVPGGQVASKLRPPFVAGREEYDQTLANLFEQRQTPALFGNGLLDEIPAAEILAREDPTDLDGDGVKGVARRLVINGVTEIGRFGWKAQIPRLRDFVKDAMVGELGITTPDDGRGFAGVSDVDLVPDPEIDEAQVDDVFFFMANLAPPPRVGSLDPQVLAGEILFDQIGCSKCHVPDLDGPDGPVRAFTDLLLHDVMSGTFQGMAEPGAGSGTYRTPALWGIRNTAPYLHDGRAENLRAAIDAHWGEAEDVRDAFQALLAGDQNALLAFLADL